MRQHSQRDKGSAVRRLSGYAVYRYGLHGHIAALGCNYTLCE